MGDETVALDDGRVRVSHTAGLRVVVDQQDTLVPAGRRRVEVRYAIEVSGSDVGGRLTITTRSRAGRLLTVLAAVEARYEVVAESTGEGRERTFTLEIPLGETRRLVVVEHAPGLSHDELAGVLPGPDDFLGPAPVRQRAFDHSRGAPALPSATPEIAWEAEMPAAAPSPPSEPAHGVLAEVGANMPSEVHLDDTVPVEVLLSREEVQVFAGTSHDEQVIVMDPDRPLDVVVLRRGFDLDDRELPRETADAASRCRRKVSPRSGSSSGCAPPRRERVRFRSSYVRTIRSPWPRCASRRPCCPGRSSPWTGRPRRRLSRHGLRCERAPVRRERHAVREPPVPGHRREPRRRRLRAVLRPRPARFQAPVHPRRGRTRRAVLTGVFSAARHRLARHQRRWRTRVARSVAFHERLRRWARSSPLDVLPPEPPRLPA